MMRVPGRRESLAEARAAGADVRIVYSPLDTLALAALLGHPLGRNAAIIGGTGDGQDTKVLLQTAAAGTRILDMLSGEQLPRIC